MSIREMIGADVESGGLFDPLGEGNSDREGKKRRCTKTKPKAEVLRMLRLKIQRVGFMSIRGQSSNRPTVSR